MKRVSALLLALAIAGAGHAGPRRPPDQDGARMGVRQGGMPLRDIQQQWQAVMPGYDYLGADYDPAGASYRLKFMRGGSVRWIDVDARTGREIGRSR